MGILKWPLEIFSADGQRSEVIEATVDTGASYTSLPASLLRSLGIEPRRMRQFELADGTVIERPISVATVRLSSEDTDTIVVFNDEGRRPLIGAYALEGCGLGADPLGQRLIPVRGLLL